MAAPKGNRFWEARSSHGRNPIFATPEKLWDACCQYFEWVEENPLYEAKLTSYQGVNKIEQLPKMRAMTISGLCLFLDICEKTWANYRSEEHEFSSNKDYLQVVTRVEKIIYNQKFSGAAAELLNSNIIARDLGLKDNTDVNINANVTTRKKLNDFYNEDSGDG